MSKPSIGTNSNKFFAPGTGSPRFTPGIREPDWRFEKNDPPKPKPDDNNAAQLAALEKWAQEREAGLVQNREDLKAEKKKVADQLKALQEQWGELNPERVKAVLAKFEGDEELKLIEEGKFEEVIERRTENLRKDLETRVTAAQDRITELEGQLAGKGEKIMTLTIDSQIRELGLAMDPPMDARALPDAIRAARDVFVLGDEDEPVAKRADGTPIIGKDGKTPLGAAEWLQTTFEGGKTLWWGSSSGGGALGGGEGDKKKVDAEARKNMSPRDKLAFGLDEAAA